MDAANVRRGLSPGAQAGSRGSNPRTGLRASLLALVCLDPLRCRGAPRVRFRSSRSDAAARRSPAGLPAPAAPGDPDWRDRDGSAVHRRAIARDRLAVRQAVGGPGHDLYGSYWRVASGQMRFFGGRYWVRTSDLFGVNEARYHCANRPRCPGGLRHLTPSWMTCCSESALLLNGLDLIPSRNGGPGPADRSGRPSAKWARCTARRRSTRRCSGSGSAGKSGRCSPRRAVGGRRARCSAR